MSALSPLPVAPNGQVAWKEFFATAKIGDPFIIPMAKRHGCISAKQYTAARFNTRSNGDGTFTLTIDGVADARHELLADFNRLSTGVLKALHDAATKSGLFGDQPSPSTQTQS
jgi:hypothetical protein